jgi:osmoprotectant transport system permease protein
VAADALALLGLVDLPAGAPGSGRTAQSQSDDSALVPYLWARRAETIRLTLRHLLLVGLSMAAGIVVAVPLGLGLERLRRGAEGVIRGVGLLQTIPSIALLAFMIPVLGIGVAPAVSALFLYSLFPIVRNTYTGVRDASPVAVEAARALGMTDTQLLTDVRLPLAAPVIMAGVRTASVINVGTATLAAFIGAGGLGDPIVAGLALSDTYMVLSGAIPAALLAFLVDGGLAAVERGVTPKGLR